MKKKDPTHIITKEFLLSVPHEPGVYLMLDKGEVVLYVGKAKDLNKRLASYRRTKSDQNSKTAIMLSRVTQIKTMLTNTEKEALILESSLIKKHKSRYNVILRDDKNYPFIKVTVNEKWPRMVMTRRRSNKGARYFGPYSSPAAMWTTMKYLGTLFPLRRCKTKNIENRKRPCLNYQMKRCPGPCIDAVDRKSYLNNVQNILLVLGGKGRYLVRDLQGKMKKASFELHFEEAALYRDQINALVKTLERQVIVSSNNLDQDVFGMATRGTAVAISILFVRSGVVYGQQSFYLPEPIDSEPEILSASIRQFYGSEIPAPDEILLPYVPEEHQLLEEWLQNLKSGKVVIKTPKKGERAELLAMAQANAAQVHRDRDKKSMEWENLAHSISEKLHLQFMPDRIECLDISNISGKQAVGSLVCFLKGEKESSQYRRYNIRTASGPDDYRMMQEVLQRRFRDVESNTDHKMVFPELLLVDGGKGQLNIALQVLKDFGLAQALDVVGIAKERGHEGEKLYVPGRKNPIILAHHSPVLLLFMRIRDEAHRFAISSHRKLRQRDAFQSELDAIPGVGSSRKKALLTGIGSLQKIKKASVQSLTKIDGIGPDLAKLIFAYFHEQEP